MTIPPSTWFFYFGGQVSLAEQNAFPAGVWPKAEADKKKFKLASLQAVFNEHGLDRYPTFSSTDVKEHTEQLLRDPAYRRGPVRQPHTQKGLPTFSRDIIALPSIC